MIPRPLLVLLGFVLLFSLACANPVLNGAVVDQGGAPLAGVEVSVLNLTQKAVTDAQGRYSLPYTPGRFSVHAALAGYTAASLDFDVTEKAELEVRTVTLWKLPTTDTLAVLQAGAYTPLPASHVMTRSSLMQSFTGIPAPSGPNLAPDATFVFFGPGAPTEGLRLSKLVFTPTVKVDGFFGSTSQRINTWMVAKDADVPFTLRAPDSATDLRLLSTKAPLAPGRYVLHWGVLSATDPFAASMVQRKLAYDFSVGAVAPAAAEEPEEEVGD